MVVDFHLSSIVELLDYSLSCVVLFGHLIVVTHLVLQLVQPGHLGAHDVLRLELGIVAGGDLGLGSSPLRSRLEHVRRNAFLLYFIEREIRIEM